MRLSHAAELSFPITVTYYPVNVATTWIGLPPCFLRCGEIYIGCGPGGIVSVEDRLDGILANKRQRDGSLDTLRRHVCDFFVDELRRKGATRASQIAPVQPLASDAL